MIILSFPKGEYSNNDLPLTIHFDKVRGIYIKLIFFHFFVSIMYDFFKKIVWFEVLQTIKNCLENNKI